MFTIIMLVALIFIGVKMVPLIFRVTWGIVKIVCTFLLLPLLIVGFVYVGLVYFAIPVLVILGLAVVVGCLARA